MSTGLLNENICKEDSKPILFEQYKLYVELTDRIGQRRATANSFFITVNVALLTVLSWFQKDFGLFIWVVAAVGILFSIFWYFTIKSYRQLSSGRFKVINQIEKQLPVNLFSYEWAILEHGKNRNVYWPLSKIEMTCPIIFLFLYIAVSVVITVYNLNTDILPSR